MVSGMSVKSGEPRGGNKKTQQTKTTKPPVEALAMARVLDDVRYPPDFTDKIRAVLTIVPHRTEEEVCIALHDADFDPEKAITVLLDTDSHSTGWTTSGGRKGKKKSLQNDGIDLIVAPGDSRSSSRGRRPGGTNKAASTRDGYGGSVSVTRGRGSSGRGRSNSAPRRDGVNKKKTTPTGAVSTDKRRGHRQPRNTKISPQPPPPLSQPTDEVWDTLPVENDRDSEVRGQPEVRGDVEEWPSSWEQTTDKGGAYWDVSEDTSTLQDEGAVAEQPVFPEAIPTSQLPHSTSSEATPTLAIADRDTSQPQSKSGQREEEGRAGRKARRIARSQIPTKPVEMRGGESLDLQFGSLGIDFGDSDPSTTNSAVSSVTSGGSYETILTYTDVHKLAEDPGVISVSTSNYRLAETQQPPAPVSTSDSPAALDGPPGLKHPGSAHDRSLESLGSVEDQRLPLSAPLSPHKDPSPDTVSLTEPIELPVTQQKLPASSGYSGAELIMSSSTPAPPTVLPTSTPSTAAGAKQVPPNMMYPAHMMHQYPAAAFMPMYPNPAAHGNYSDDMSRYQASVSLAAAAGYYPSAATGAVDPTLSAPAGTREQAYTSVGGDKFGRSGSEVNVTMTQSSGATSQGVAAGSGGMQPTFMNYPNMYPSNMFYPAMYFPAAAAHSMAPKPSTGGSTFPVAGSTYQGGGANYTYDDLTSSHDYTKMYSGSKGSNMTKGSSAATAADMTLGGSYKQQQPPHFDKTPPGGSSYQQQQQSFGLQNQQYMHAAGYMQAVPMPPHTIPMMQGAGAGETGRKHSNKTGAYQSNSFWGGQST